MAAKSRHSENRIQKQLQEVVLRAAVGRSIPPIESAINLYLSEGNRKPKEILDTFPEDLGVKVWMILMFILAGACMSVMRSLGRWIYCVHESVNVKINTALP